MARQRALSAKEVDAKRDVGMHWVSDNLYLQIREPSTRSWLFRYWVDGKPKVIGLGAAKDVPLARARDKAERLRIQIRDGADPAADRIAAKAQKMVKRAVTVAAKVPTFEECGREYINAHEPSWSNDKHRAQWPSTLKMYVYPLMGRKPVNEIGIEDVVKVLKPIWTTKPPTAGNVRGRIDKILGWATAMGYRTGDNPASRDGPLMHLLPSLSKVQRHQKHHKALPYKDAPSVVADIRKLESTSASALLFTILTAARTGETLGATWDEINFDDRLWTIPAERMKARSEHQVPLPEEAIALLITLSRDPAGKNPHLFPGQRAKTLTNMAMLQCLRGVHGDGSTVHGFRAAFSTWAREQTDYSPEIVEASLAHTQSDKVVAAYARTTFLDRRRTLMQEWATFCMSG